MTPKIKAEILAAQQLCQSLWPGAEIKTNCPEVNHTFDWVIWVEITESFCVEIVGRPTEWGSESSASCGRDMGTVIARSIRSPGVGWEKALLEVAEQLEVLAAKIKPNIVGAKKSP